MKEEKGTRRMKERRRRAKDKDMKKNILIQLQKLIFPTRKFNPLNAELNPICHFLALLGGATIVVVSRLRVKGKCSFQPTKVIIFMTYLKLRNSVLPSDLT
jgi:hypothetical protein